MRRTKLVDRGYIARMRRLRELNGLAVTVGVQSDAGASESGTLIAEYAAYNEFGTRTIPSRPAMRNAFDTNAPELTDTIKVLKDAVEDGKETAQGAAGLLGELHQQQVQDQIRSNTPPPNAASTVQAKGSSKTLIDTGAYLQAIRWRVEKKRGRVGRIIDSLFRKGN